MHPFRLGFLIRVSFVLTLTAFLLSLYIFKAGRPNAETFSYIGEANRVWYFFYSLTLVLAFSLNLVIYTIRNSIKNKCVLFSLYTLLALAIIFSFLQSIIIDPVFHEIHILLAGIFTGFSCLALITAIVTKLVFTKSKIVYYYLFMIVLIGGINFYAIHAYGWLIATYQWLFASVMLASSSALALIKF